MKLRWQAFLERSSLKQVLLFVSIFFGLHYLLQVTLGFILQAFGIHPLAVREVLNDNEVAIQLSSLISACYAVQRLYRAPAFLRDFLWGDYLSGFWRGFMLASAGVAVSLFLGFAAIESSQVDFGALWQLFPGLLLQITLLMAWFFAVEWMRLVLSWLVVNRDPRILRGRLVIIAIEAFLYFQLLGDFGPSSEQLALAAVCFLAAASSYLWFEFERWDAKRLRHARMLRIGWQAGFWVTLLHIYGQRIGNFKGFSIMHLFDGPLPFLKSVLPTENSASQVFAVLGLIVLTNTLLQKVLARLASRPNQL